MAVAVTALVGLTACGGNDAPQQTGVLRDYAVSGVTWTVGLALSGSPAGLTLVQYQTAPAGQPDAIRSKVTPKFETAGAHYMIATVANLPLVLKDIERRLAAGERPLYGRVKTINDL